MHMLKRSLLLLGLSAFIVTACSDDDTVAPVDTIAVTNISVSPPNLTITAGQSAQVSATVQTNGGTGDIDLGVNWSTSNAAVVGVSATGLLTAGTAGTATVTATSKANSNFSATIAVTVVGLPTAPNALLSFNITPTSVSIVQGGTATTSTISSLSTGGSVSYSSVSSSPNCTVSATGANPTITAVSVGTCVVTVTATGSGTGLVTNSIAQAIAVTVTAQATALQSLTVSPTAVSMVPAQTQVVTTTTQAAAGASVAYANSSSNNAVATVTSTGANPTITATGNGTAQITIRATGSGTGLQTNSISAIVLVNVQAASVSISSLTTCVGAAPCVVTPVNLAGAFGQIEATLNINSGNQQIGSVAVFLGAPVAGSCTVGVSYTEAARQIFGVNGAPAAPVTLSVNTAEFNPTTYVPKWLNGLNCIQAQLFPVSGPAPDASNTIQFALVNPDVVYFNATTGTTSGAFGLHHTGNSATQASGPANTWWRGGFTWRPHPVLYSGASNVTSISYTSTSCGGAAGTAGSGWAATFSCAGVETSQNIANAVTVNYVAGYTLTASPTTYMTPASAGFVPGNPVYATVTTREDNVGPRTHTPLYVAAGAGGWHGNGSAGTLLPTSSVGGTAVKAPTSYTVTATDFGVGGTVAGAGLAAAPTITEITVPVTFGSGSTPAGIPLAETLTPVPYNLRGDFVADILGNTGVSTTTVATLCTVGGAPTGSTSRCANSSVLFGVFGVDLAVLDAQYGDRTNSATAGVVWQGLTNKIYAANAVTGGVSPGTGATGQVVTDWDVAVGAPDGAAENIIIDAIDSRSGLDNATALTQKIHRANAGVSTNCLAFGTYAMGPPILVDNYVQSAPQQFDCGLAAGARVGEYTWAGYVSDRAGNARFPSSATSPPLAGTVTMLRMAIDEALPNITGIGFQTSLYTGGAAATYSFSANDDLELWQGTVMLGYAGHAPVSYPYGAAAYTTPAFGTPFDGVFANVLNGQSLTLGYYINQYDFTTTAAFVPGAVPSGNVAGFTSGGVNTSVTANVRDVAAQSAAAPLVAPVLVTQLSVRVGAPAYAGSMIDFRIISKSGTNVLTVQDASPSSIGLAYCDRVDVYEVVDAGGVAPAAGMAANNAAIGDAAGDMLVWRSTVTTVPVPGAIPDNGFQRFLNYVSAAHTNVGTGLYVAACVKSGSALMSMLF